MAALLPEPADRRNFRWAALNGALFEFGAAFAETGTVVAAFLTRTGAGPLAVGAAAAIARFGWFFPQLFAAHYARGLPYRKPIYLIGGGGRAVALGILALVFLVVPAETSTSPVPILAFFFVLWTVFSFVAGLAGVPYNDVIARTILPEWRSRLLATRLFLGGALAAAGGLLIRAILRAHPDAAPYPYGLIFGTGALVLALSTACFAMIHEPPAPLPPERPGFGVFLSAGWDVLRDDRRFRLFLYTQLLSGVTKMSAPFYLVQARAVSGVPEFEVGTLLAAQTIGGIVLNPVWGWWGDRRGKLGLLTILAIVSGIAPLLALALPPLGLSPTRTLAGYAIVFFFVGATLSGEVVADLGYLMEISPDARRPEYSGYMNALVAPSRLLPFVGGLGVALLSFEILFAVAVAAVAARLAVLARLHRVSPAAPERARPARASR